MADLARSKRHTSGRAWWGLAALGAFVIALAGRALLPHRSHSKPQQPAPVAKSQEANDPARDHQKNPTTAFESSDWSLRPVALIYLAIPVLLVVSAFVLIAAYPHALPDVDRTLRIAPPGPRLETDPQGDLQKLRAAEERRLNSYYWVDRQKGVVHIPVEQAMKKLVTTGAPGFPKEQGQR